MGRREFINHCPRDLGRWPGSHLCPRLLRRTPCSTCWPSPPRPSHRACQIRWKMSPKSNEKRNKSEYKGTTSTHRGVIAVVEAFARKVGLGRCGIRAGGPAARVDRGHHIHDVVPQAGRVDGLHRLGRPPPVITDDPSKFQKIKTGFTGPFRDPRAATAVARQGVSVTLAFRGRRIPPADPLAAVRDLPRCVGFRAIHVVHNWVHTFTLCRIIAAFQSFARNNQGKLGCLVKYQAIYNAVPTVLLARSQSQPPILPMYGTLLPYVQSNVAVSSHVTGSVCTRGLPAEPAGQCQPVSP